MLTHLDFVKSNILVKIVKSSHRKNSNKLCNTYTRTGEQGHKGKKQPQKILRNARQVMIIIITKQQQS